MRSARRRTPGTQQKSASYGRLLQGVALGVLVCWGVMFAAGFIRTSDKGVKTAEIDGESSELEKLRVSVEYLGKRNSELENQLDNPGLDDDGSPAFRELRLSYASLEKQNMELEQKLIDLAHHERTPFVPKFECREPRVAIAGLVRHTPIVDMEFWLDYHFSIGVCHVFFRVQSTPTLRYLFELPKYSGRTTITWVEDSDITTCQEGAMTQNKSCKIYMDLITWQTNYMNSAIQVAKTKGMDFIFHMDDDELFWMHNLTHVSDFFKTVPEDSSDIHFENYEHFLNQYGHDSPFAPHRFAASTFLRGGRLSYANGKSAGRVSDTLRLRGPHNMGGKTYAVPKTEAVVLHYESAHIIDWFKKFITYSTDSLAMIPFGYYKESIEAVQVSREYFLKKKKMRTWEKEHPEGIMQVELEDRVEEYRKVVAAELRGQEIQYHAGDDKFDA